MGLSSLGSNDNLSITTSTLPVSGSNNGQVSVGNNSAALPIIDDKKQKLLEKFNLTFEQYDAIIAKNPEFPMLSESEQLEIVNNSRNDEPVNSEVAEAPEEQDVTLSFDRRTYSALQTTDEKIDACYTEFAKNLFIYGSTKLNIPAHSADEWNKLSPEAQQTEVAKIKDYIAQNDELGLKAKFGTITDDTMTLIQAANSRNGVGTSCLDLLLTKTAGEILDIKNEYLSGLKEDGVQLSGTEEETLTYRNFLANAVISEVNKRNVAAGREEFMGTLGSSDDISEYLRLYNLDEKELVFNALKDKTDRNPQEEKVFQRLSGVYGSEVGQNLVKQDKIANLVKLQAEFAELQAKAQTEELLGEDLQRFNILQETLNTSEAKELLGLAQYLPQPETDFEKSVCQDIQTLKTQNQEFLGSEIEVLNSIRFIESKTAGMSRDEKANYIVNFLIYTDSGNKTELFAKYLNDYPEINKDPRLTGVASLNTDKMNSDQYRDACETRITASKSDNPLMHDQAIAAQQYSNNILTSKKCSGSEFDEHKITNAYCAANMHYVTPEEATETLNGATDVNITITDANIQMEAQNEITNSESATEEVHIHTASKAGDFHKDNQLGVLDGATSHSAKATAFVAENDILKTLDPENQSDAYSLIQNRINEQYQGADVDKYSSALAGQIKNCDPSVQGDLMSKVFASGNQKAIETAISNISDFKSPDVQQIVLKQAVMELANGTLNNDEIAKLSPEERREYFTKLFDNATFSDQVKFLKDILNSNTGARNKVTVYNMIGKFYPTLFETLVKDPEVAEQMLTMPGLDVKLLGKTRNVIHNYASINSKMNDLAIKYHLSNSVPFEEYPQMAKTLNYSFIPGGFSNEKFNMFGKDRNGNLLV